MDINWGSGLATAGLFLGIPAILLIFFAQWQWAKTCEKNIRVLVAQKTGGGRFFNAPKAGGDVTIKNTETGDVRAWPINELATIEVPYPGVGWVPKFLQKTIRLAIVNEGDWEPMLNRSPHQQRVASPDVIEFMQSIAKKSPELEPIISKYLSKVSSGSTREMIADPAILGALKQSTVMKALAQVSDELVEAIKSLRAQLTRVGGLNPMLVYIVLIAAVGVGIAGLVLTIKGGGADMMSKIDAIYKALGIQP